MLREHNSSAIVAVSDIGRAQSFYSHTLGLELAEGSTGAGPLVYKTGATRLTVYPSKEAGTNRANAVCWAVGEDLDAIVAALSAEGLQFEHYAGIGRLDGDVHVIESMGPPNAEGAPGDARLVWFKDPDGNILHINNLPMP